jgi:ATP-dependent DNA helicase DinG
MTWQTAQTAFAEALPGYENRPHQTRLAETIEKAFANGQQLAAQAGTGTGKSLAGLVPAIEHARETGLPVIVSTATISLLTQYAGKDLPFLEEVLDTDFRWALLKGRGNYACKAKLVELDSNTIANQATILGELANEDHTGDVLDLSVAVDVKDKMKITSTSDECPGKSNCPFGEVCFAERAKAKAREADVILVTHAMLATDLVVRTAQLSVNPDKEPTSVLPTFGSVLIDEGHKFADYMSGALSNEFSERGIAFLASEVTGLVGKSATVSALNGAARMLFTRLGTMLAKARKDSVRIDDNDVLKLQDVLVGLFDVIIAVRDMIKGFDATGNDKKKIRRMRLIKRTETAANRLSDLITNEDSGLVRWIERDPRKDDVRLKYAPLTVSHFLRQNLWGEGHSGVVLSATMGVGTDFSFVTNELGMTNPAKFDAGSPFNYPQQARLFIPDGFDPSPRNTPRWRVQAQETMKRLVLAAGGGALLLFTSTSAMKEAYAALSMTFENAGLRTLIQGGDLNNRQIAETFKEDVNSVLFGLESFATGFDIQGHALRLVVVDKAPFTSPDDVMFAARSEVIDAKANGRFMDGSFMRLAVPTMALTLFQGAGRLIRTGTDEGLIAILDSRLTTKGYGKTIVKALPPATRVNTLPEAEKYLEDLNARKG